jgi:excisionase family DNA binding protein
MTKPMNVDEALMKVGEVADYLHVHRSTIYKMLRSGELPAFRIGSDWRFRIEAVDRWRLERGKDTSER